MILVSSLIKLFSLFLVISSEVKMEVDNVDGDQLLNPTELWSDMIVFSSLMPSKLQSSLADCMLSQQLHIVNANISSQVLLCTGFK